MPIVDGSGRVLTRTELRQRGINLEDLEPADVPPPTPAEEVPELLREQVGLLREIRDRLDTQIDFLGDLVSYSRR